MTWAAVLVKNEHKMPYIHIHAYTYRYIPYIHIHTYTYTYSPPSNRVKWGFAGGAAAAQDPAARNSPPRSARMGLDARSPYANSVGGDHWWRQGLALPPPNACCARGCAKPGPGVGHRWLKKVVWLLLRVDLSGACRVLPQLGVFGGCCDGISACLGQYIRYIQHRYNTHNVLYVYT